MQIETFVLCDAATDYFGKLNVLGAFDTIWSPNVPAVYPQCSLALRIRFSAIERGEHKVKVNFVDADGSHLIPAADGILNVNFSDQQRTGAANLILNIQGLKLPKYGEYSIDLAVDDRALGSLPLYLRQPEKNFTS